VSEVNPFLKYKGEKGNDEERVEEKEKEYI
jgi:hypothetical protein